MNVSQQRRDPQSQLNWMERLIRARKECRELGWGSCQVLASGSRSVLALHYTWRQSRMVVVHNLSSRPLSVRLDLKDPEQQRCPLLNVLSTDHCAPGEDGRHSLTLEGYAYRWFRVGAQDDARPGSASA